MTDDEIRTLILHELGNIAPEVDLEHIDPTVELREQLDLDSMDILNWVVAIHETTGIDIPEADYPHMTTLNSSVTYLHPRLVNK